MESQTGFPESYPGSRRSCFRCFRSEGEAHRRDRTPKKRGPGRRQRSELVYRRPGPSCVYPVLDWLLFLKPEVAPLKLVSLEQRPPAVGEPYNNESRVCKGFYHFSSGITLTKARFLCLPDRSL